MEKLFLSALAAALLASMLPAPAVAATCAVGTPETVAVAEAIDGDTLRLVDGREVRVAGIAAVKVAPGGAAALVRLDQAARAELAALAAGALTLATTSSEPDRYGRLHAMLTTGDGRSVAELLVAAGLARVRPFPGEIACMMPLLVPEAEARADRRGLWAVPSFAVLPADDTARLNDAVGRFVLVAGRVASVGHGRTVIFIDFGRDYRRDFTIMVPQSVSQGFAVPVDGLKGRRIRVRGVIEASGGPAIWLSDPAEIELLDEDDGGGGQG